MSPALEVVPYDPTWPHAFAVERDRIVETLGAIAVRVEHHGSTAVPGLAAKPVIDIQVSVRTLHPIDAYRPLLTRIGYVHVPHPDDDRCPFFHRPEAWPHTHHIHVVELGSDEERRTLAFRDYLREHPEVATEYEGLKRELAAGQRDATFASREAYAEAKGAFVGRITDLALAEGLPA